LVERDFLRGPLGYHRAPNSAVQVRLDS